MVSRDGDVVLKPHTWNERWPWRVLLEAIVVSTEMVNEIARRNLVDRSGPILPEAVWFRSPAIEVLVYIAASVVVDLNFKARDDGAPRGIASNFVRVGSRRKVRRKA